MIGVPFFFERRLLKMAMEGNCGNICESNINFLNTCFQQDVRSMCNMGEVDDDDEGDDW